MNVRLYPFPTYGDVMPLNDFVDDCNSKAFVDSDGSGYYATPSSMTRIPAIPSNIRDGNIRRSFTHVIWFNK